MISLYIIIIIIIILLELYIRYFDNVNECMDDKINKDNINKDILNKDNINKEPWYKIKKNNKITKYYLKINNFNQDNYIEWKNITKKIDYNISQNLLIISSETEAEALSIANLYISSINNDITIEEIINNNLIELSKKKALMNKLVVTKLIILIKIGLNKINNINNMDMDSDNINIDTTEMEMLSMIDTLDIEDDSNEEIILDDSHVSVDDMDISSNSTKQSHTIYNIDEQFNPVDVLDSIDNTNTKINYKMVNDMEEPKYKKESLKIEPYGGIEYASIF